MATDMTIPEIDHRAGIDATARTLLFTGARTVNNFSAERVDDSQLAQIWELARWAPTSANIQPLHVTWVRTEAAKARLLPAMLEFNRDKTASAPATAILSIDPEFHVRAEELLPYAPEAWASFADPAMRADMGRFNGAMQSAYFILAVRAVGLMAGPMLGFDPAAVADEFLSATQLQPILVVNVGHPGDNPWFERLPRIAVDEAVTWT